MLLILTVNNNDNNLYVRTKEDNTFSVKRPLIDQGPVIDQLVVTGY